MCAFVVLIFDAIKIVFHGVCTNLHSYYHCKRVFSSSSLVKILLGASLVAQWLKICLPMQGTRVRALVWEDPTCRGATGPVSHNY